MKKAVSVLISLIMLINFSFLQAFDAYAATYSGTCGKSVSYTLDTSTGVLNITGSGEMSNYTLSTLPNWHKYKSYIKTVNIQNGITNIGECMFSECSNLTSVTIPDSVVTIGQYAFNKCSNLKSITIPDSVTYIANKTFYYCNNLQSIKLSENITEIAHGTFQFCSSLNNVTIPNRVASILPYAFSNCKKLYNINIPGCVTSIGESAFYSCNSVTIKTIMGSYTDYYAQQNKISVSYFSPTSIQLISLPSVLDYYIGDMPDLSGISAYVFFENGEAKTVYSNSLYTYSRVNYLGSNDIYVGYNENGISVYTAYQVSGKLPKISIYHEGKDVEEFDILAGYGKFDAVTYPANQAVTWTSSNPSVLTILNSSTGEYNVIGRGDTTVTASFVYNGRTYTTSVIVHMKSFAERTESPQPEQLTYSAGEPFNPNVSFTAIFDDGSQRQITLSQSDVATFAGMNGDTSTAGAHNVSFNYMGALVSYTYYVYDTAENTNVSLSQNSFTYNKKSHKPSVTVTDRNGNIVDPSNYTVTYSKGRKNVGVYSVTVNFKSYYSGSVTKAFTVKPKKVSINKLSGGRKSLKVEWKKQTAQVTGYQIQYSTSKAFTKKTTKTLTVKKNKTTAATLKKLKVGKKYYVKIRTYKTVKQNGKSIKIYSDWSKVKSVKVKK